MSLRLDPPIHYLHMDTDGGMHLVLFKTEKDLKEYITTEIMDHHLRRGRLSETHLAKLVIEGNRGEAWDLAWEEIREIESDSCEYYNWGQIGKLPDHNHPIVDCY